IRIAHPMRTVPHDDSLRGYRLREAGSFDSRQHGRFERSAGNSLWPLRPGAHLACRSGAVPAGIAAQVLCRVILAPGEAHEGFQLVRDINGADRYGACLDRTGHLAVEALERVAESGSGSGLGLAAGEVDSLRLRPVNGAHAHWTWLA